jgi:N-acetylmuramoyl-L-alanine amidase
MAAGQPFVYADAVDTTFVLGRVVPPGGRLIINGQPVPTTAHGAFLARLPLRKGVGERTWNLTLWDSQAQIAALVFPYGLASENAAPFLDTGQVVDFPRVGRVSVTNAHLRTCREGSYFVFPDVGTQLLVTGRDNGLYQCDLGGRLFGEIEAESVELTADSVLSPCLVGNGLCRAEGGQLICAFGLSSPVAWTADVLPDGRTLDVELFRARAAIQMIGFDSKARQIRDVTWNQLPDGLKMQFRCAFPLSAGHEVRCERDSLFVRLKPPYSKRERRLRGKMIVLDPGHGGTATGAIGPLGTIEKDVVLTLARMVRAQLEKRGAVVKMTRDGDCDIAVYARVDSARAWNADFLLSLHCNALPDAENPFERHGAGTYYDQSYSRPAAELLQTKVTEAAGLRDDGIWNASLAVVRPTAFPSVLLETAYIIYPPEEELLRSEHFLRTMSQAVVAALDDYFRSEP